MEHRPLEKSELFPQRFEFFHLGKVEKSTKPCELDDMAVSPFIVFFRISGDELGHCAVAFETKPKGFDEESMAVELANILVSKFANQLAEFTHGTVEISPPELLQTSERRHRLLLTALRAATTARGGSTPASRYEYSEGKTKTILRMAYIAAPTGQS